MALVLKLGELAAGHGHLIDMKESGWTASPTSVSLRTRLIIPSLTTIRWTACKQMGMIVGSGC